MPQVSLPVSDFPDLESCRPGDHITVEITENDGTNVVGDIVDIETEEDEEESSEETPMKEERMGKPIAIIAIGTKPK